MWTRKRKSSSALLAIAGLCVAYASQPASARDRWYVGGEAGVVGLEDIPLDIGPTPLSTPASLRPEYDYGYGFGAVIGYDIGSFGLALEAEINFRRSRVGGFRDIGVFLPSIDIPLESGRASALSFMINGLYDVGTIQGFTFSGGGGIGVARVEFANLRERGAVEPFINASDTNIAFQAIAAVRRAITQSVDVGVKYKFFAVPNLTIDTVAGDRISTSYRSHSAMFSIIYNFPTSPPR
jgi:OmpA-OmpF porin, OOP family